MTDICEKDRLNTHRPMIIAYDHALQDKLAMIGFLWQLFVE